MDELVSIIMPSYNTANYIAASIQSVLDQTYQNWELLLVDDCSTDDTDAVVAPFLSDARIRYLKNDRNSGAPSPETARCARPRDGGLRFWTAMIYGTPRSWKRSSDLCRSTDTTFPTRITKRSTKPARKPACLCPVRSGLQEPAYTISAGRAA